MSKLNEKKYRVALAELGWPQWRLASTLNISPTTLSSYRRGHRVPPPNVLVALEKLLSLPKGALSELPQPTAK